jgi:hypothetical protein
MAKGSDSHLVQIVFLVNLLLNLTIRSKLQQIRVFLPSHLGGVNIGLSQTILQLVHGSARIFHLLVYGVLEITREIFDLLDFLIQITSQSYKSQNDIILNFF